MDKRLRIALQKSGKLSLGSIDLLNKCGFNVSPSRTHYLLKFDELNTDFLMVRDDDILGFIDSDVADAGIIGENLFAEYTLVNPKHNLEIVTKLDFATCRLSIAVKLQDKIKVLGDLNGKTIATSYPATLANYLSQNKVKANIIVMHGSVELAPKIEIADAICDLVSTGTTLKENDLIEMETVLYSQAVLVIRKNISDANRYMIEELMFRFHSVIRAKNSKYIMLHIAKKALPQLQSLLPGCESPTIIQLQAQPDKVAVHVVSKEQHFWSTINTLKSIGASSILVMDIEKMME